jgi:hypothetical protein
MFQAYFLGKAIFIFAEFIFCTVPFKIKIVKIRRIYQSVLLGIVRSLCVSNSCAEIDLFFIF